MENILSCSTHSYHGYSLERALEGIARSGLKYVEVAAIPGHTEHVKPEVMSVGDMKELKDKLTSYGLKATSISGHSPLNTKDGLALFLKRLELAEMLNIKYVNTADGDTTTDAGKQAFLENIRIAADYCNNITICLETHGGLVGDAESCKKTLEEIGKKNVRINYDPANLIMFEGKRPEEDIAASVPFIGHFHIKDKLEGKGVWNFPTIGTGNIDYRLILSALKEGAYFGPLSFELEYTPDRIETAEYIDDSLTQSVIYIQNIIKGINW